MDREKKKSKTSENKFNDYKKREGYVEIENIILRDKSFENNPKDPQKPLYLYRYE
jgi:hypothetical protein